MQPARELTLSVAQLLDGLAIIRGHEALHRTPAAKLLWQQLWTDAGCRQGQIQTSYGALADQLGVDARALRDSHRGPGPLSRLVEIGAVEGSLEGPTLRLYVVRLADVGKPREARAPDPQQTFLEDEPETVAGPTPQPVIVSIERVGEVRAHVSDRLGEVRTHSSEAENTETAELQALVIRRQREIQAQLAPGAPRAVGEILPQANAQLARPMRERSNVLKKEISNYVPLNVLGDVEKSAELGDVGPQGDKAAEFRAEVQDLVAKLGQPDQFTNALSLVMAWYAGPLSCEQYRQMVIDAAKHPLPNRWKVISGAYSNQVRECGREVANKAGLWDCAKDAPQFYRYKSLRAKLKAVGLPWNPSWARRHKTAREPHDKPP